MIDQRLSAITHKLNQLEQLHAEIAAIARTNDPERKRELVELRRRLAAQIG